MKPCDTTTDEVSVHILILIFFINFKINHTMCIFHVGDTLLANKTLKNIQ